MLCIRMYTYRCTNIFQRLLKDQRRSRVIFAEVFLLLPVIDERSGFIVLLKYTFLLKL